MEDRGKNDLILYQIVNEKINNESDEFYGINNMFILIQTLGIFGVVNLINDYSGISIFIKLIPVSILLITALIWLVVDLKMKIWKNHWIDKACIIEKSMENDNYKLWESTEKNRVLRSAYGVWKYITFLPIIFILFWFILSFVILLQH